MSTLDKHCHECGLCGRDFWCRCTVSLEWDDQRGCPECANNYRRIRDARTFSSYRTLKRAGHR